VRHPLYGVTGDLRRRVWEHKQRSTGGFTAKYGLHRLVYFETFQAVRFAIAREKQIKAGSRTAKLRLIERENPQWSDLAEGWY